MISQANIKWISTLSGVSVEEISSALSKEEEVVLDLKLSGRVISQDDETKLKNDSFKRGSEIRTKELAKALDISLGEGEHKQDITVLADKIKTTVTTVLEDKYKGQTPSDELKAAEQKVIDSEIKYNKLKETYDGASGQIEELNNQYSTLQKDIKIKEANNTILKSFPEKMSFNRDHALILVNNILEKEESESGIIYKRDGKVISDEFGNPQTIDKIIPSLSEELGWIKGHGMGGGDRNQEGSNVKGLSNDEAMKHLEEAGIDPMSTEGASKMIEYTS